MDSQFGAAITMLDAAVASCPKELWDDRRRTPPFWHIAYHVTFFLDLYLCDSEEAFRPAPFHQENAQFLGSIPFPPYQVETPPMLCTGEELRGYIAETRSRAGKTIADVTEAQLRERCAFSWLPFSVLELFLYNLRHVQHHTGQLNSILRDSTGDAPAWVGMTDRK